MHLFIMRHGEAELMANSDKARHLNANGREQSRLQGMWLKSTALEFDKVLVSPYTRALETFDEINQVFEQQLSDKLEVWEGITPYGDSGLVGSYVALLEKEGHRNILLISHLPLVGDIVKELCGRNPASFYPGAIVDIHWDNDQPKVNDIKYVSKIA